MKSLVDSHFLIMSLIDDLPFLVDKETLGGDDEAEMRSNSYELIALLDMKKMVF